MDIDKRVEKIITIAGSFGIELPNELERAIHTAIHDAEADAVQVIGGSAATKRWYGLADQDLDPAKNWGRTWERPETAELPMGGRPGRGFSGGRMGGRN